MAGNVKNGHFRMDGSRYEGMAVTHVHRRECISVCVYGHLGICYVGRQVFKACSVILMCTHTHMNYDF